MGLVSAVPLGAGGLTYETAKAKGVRGPAVCKILGRGPRRLSPREPGPLQLGLPRLPLPRGSCSSSGGCRRGPAFPDPMPALCLECFSALVPQEWGVRGPAGNTPSPSPHPFPRPLAGGGEQGWGVAPDPSLPVLGRPAHLSRRETFSTR